MAINLQQYQVTLNLYEPMLGTTPLDVQVFRDHVAKPEVDPDLIAEECETIEEPDVPGWTGFHKDEKGKPFILNYMIKGALKGACSALRRTPTTESKKLVAFRKVIDQHVFIVPRRIYLRLPDGEDILRAEDYVDEEADARLTVPNKRPLRGMTAQGERITIARSESAPVGTELYFTLTVIDGSPVTEKLLREWFSYGLLMGLGQWRGAGFGVFGYEMTRVK